MIDLYIYPWCTHKSLETLHKLDVLLIAMRFLKAQLLIIGKHSLESS